MAGASTAGTTCADSVSMSYESVLSHLSLAAGEYGQYAAAVSESPTASICLLWAFSAPMLPSFRTGAFSIATEPSMVAGPLSVKAPTW